VLTRTGLGVAVAAVLLVAFGLGWSYSEFVVLGVSMEPPSAVSHAEQILGRVRALAVHHPRSPTGRYLTMSCGIVTSAAGRSSECESILEAAAKALLKAKTDGGNRVVGGEPK